MRQLPTIPKNHSFEHTIKITAHRPINNLNHLKIKAGPVTIGAEATVNVGIPDQI